MTSSYFLDTSFVIALSLESDEFHSRASRLAAGFRSDSIRIVTTQAILIEIGNAFSKTRYRNLAIDFFDKADQEPFLEVLSLNDDLVEAGIDLFRRRMDKNWSLVDCISFLVMENVGITDALTSDEHFSQAGFRSLLRED